MVRKVPIAALLALAAACATPEGHPPEHVRAVAQRRPGCEVAVCYRDLEGGRGFELAGDELFHAASTMKVPVMIEIYRQAEAGLLDLDAGYPVENEFASIVDGSPYALDPEQDGDPELYAQLGAEVPLRELVRRMIVRSSNLATNLLIELAGAEDVQATIERLGAKHMRVLRGVEDEQAYQAGLSNSATAHDLAVLLAAIADGTAVSPASAAEMLAVLEAQEFNDLIPAGLPPGTRVAHKTGQITAIHHDAALVFPAGAAPYVLVVLTRGFDDPDESARTIAEIAGLVHAEHLRGR